MWTMRGRRVWFVSVVALAVGACGGGMQAQDGGPSDTGSSDTGSPPDGMTPGMCSADVPAGQACNTLANVGTVFTPTCASGAEPTGTGGTVVDGTYVLTSEAYYGETGGCSGHLALSTTITIAGDCLQMVFGEILSGTISGRFTVQGNTFMATSTCEHFDNDGAVLTHNPNTTTYTATDTTFTLFTVNTAAGATSAGYVAVYTRR